MSEEPREAHMQPKSVKFMNGLLNKFETATPRMPGWTTKKLGGTEIGAKV